MSETVAAAQEAREPPVKKMATHPKVSVMVNSAIAALKERKGSSQHAIKKYISANYDADPQKLAHHIKKYLKSGVESGKLIQPTGKGAIGSFKINLKPVAEPKGPKVKSPKIPKLPSSTPRKTNKSKKNVPPNASPIISQPLGDGEEAPEDATFIAPNKKAAKKPRVSVRLSNKSRKSRILDKVKKPKKLSAKKAASRKVLSNEAGKSTSVAKPEGTLDSKATKPVKKKASAPAASVAKKTVPKKTTAPAAFVTK